MFIENEGCQWWRGTYQALGDIESFGFFFVLDNLLAAACSSPILSINTQTFKMAQPKTLKIGGKDITIPTGLFINNEFVEAIGKKTFGIENPATGEVVIEVQEGQAEDVDVAVKAARKTFKSKEWRDTAPAARAAILHKLADLMEQHAEQLCAVEMLDTGKTHKQASNLDVPGSIGTLRYYAGWCDKIEGLASFNIPGTFAYTRREPVGVCGQIIPWK